MSYSRRLLSGLAFGALVALTPLSAPAAFAIQGEGFAHERSDILPDPAVRYGQLENGLRYAILVNDTPPNTASLRMAFNVGSMVEDDDQRGLAHFLEHMAFNGSENVPEGEMVALLERFGLAFGPDTNAGTARELVVYQLDMPETDAETLNTGLFLMRETASNLLLDADAIDREREVIVSEERVRNTPIRRWNNALTEFRYPGSLAAQRDAIGLVDVIRTAPQEAFQRYYDEYYTPDRAMLVAVGDFDPDAVEAEIRSRFADWEMPENPGEDVVGASVDEDREFATAYFQDSEIFTILTIDVMEPGSLQPDTAENRYQNLLRSLGFGILNRRFQTIVNSGTSPLLQAGGSYSTAEYDVANRASLLAVASPERWDEGLALIEQELRRALEHGFTQAELAEQLTNTRTALENSVEQAGTRGTSALSDAIWSAWLGSQVFSHPSAALERYNAFEASITTEAVEAAFREVWQGNGPLIMLATPADVENAEARIAEVWEDSQSVEVEAMEEVELAAWAYEDFGVAGDVVDRRTVDDLGVTQLTFDNGLQVSLKQTDFEDDVIRVNVRFGRGDIEPLPVTAVDSVAGSTFASGGLGQHSFDEIQRILAGRTVGVGFGVGTGQFSFSNATTPDDFLLQLQLIAAYMTDPGYRPESLAQVRATSPEIRRNLRSTPAGVLQLDVARMLRSGDTRFGYPLPEEFDAVTLDHVRDFLTPALTEAPIEVTIVGDFDEAAVIEALSQTLGALPDRAESWPEYDENRQISFPEPTEEPITLRHNGGEDQALVNVYWPTRDNTDAREARALRLMRAVLDLKLTERLREGEGFTYSAYSTNNESTHYPDYGYLWVGADIRLENIEAVYETIGMIANDMVNGEITDDELLRARQPLVEQIENAFESNSAWLSWLVGSIETPERLDRIRSLVGDYNEISLEDIVETAQSYIRQDTAFEVTILPNEAED